MCAGCAEVGANIAARTGAGARRDVRRADSISNDAIKRQATVTLPLDPPVTARLDAVLQVADRVTFVVVEDGRRAIYQLPADAHVDVHRQEATA